MPFKILLFKYPEAFIYLLFGIVQMAVKLYAIYFENCSIFIHRAYPPAYAFEFVVSFISKHLHHDSLSNCIRQTRKRKPTKTGS